MVFAGKWRMADVRWAPPAGGGDDGSKGGDCLPQTVCQLLFAVDTQIWLEDNFYERTWYGLRAPPSAQTAQFS